MTIKFPRQKALVRRGFLQIDLIAALTILTIVIVPLGYSFARERKALKAEYYRSVINELVDGEMEILVAGAANELPVGSQPILLSSRAADQLPQGHFQLTKTGAHLRLEWTPDSKCGVSAVIREADLK